MRCLLTVLSAGLLAQVSFAQDSVQNITLTTFNAVPRNAQVILSWEHQPGGVKLYEFEKSTNGTDFSSFGYVQAGEYQAEFLETDFYPSIGMSYYRLKMVHADGTVSFSNTVPVKYDENGQPVSPVAGQAVNNPPGSSLLVIVRSNDGQEFYSKVVVDDNGNPVLCESPDPLINSGTYTIIGCSNQQYYSRQLVVH